MKFIMGTKSKCQFFANLITIPKKLRWRNFRKLFSKNTYEFFKIELIAIDHVLYVYQKYKRLDISI